MADLTATPQVWAFTQHEHLELRRGIDRVHDVGCEIAGWIGAGTTDRLVAIVDWFDHVLEPHLAWEEAWLYPEIDVRAGTAWATRSARFDHQQVRLMADRLRDDMRHLGDADASDRLSDLRCRLFGLEALLRAHIEREERFLIPLLAEAYPTAVAAAERSSDPPRTRVEP
jgi:hemerythrin-like domain-containing protein